MRVVRWVLRFVGWLLTPIVAWAASFVGATAGARLFRSAAPTTNLILAVVSGAVVAVVVLIGWLRLLRRSPRLQHVLEVTEDGTPVAALEAGAEGS
ncbi:MAG: hypothetical protein R2909_05185 [Gemmatimonadales bacterium]